VYYFWEWWLMTHRIDRFLVPLIPALALMAGIGATWSRAEAWKWVLRGYLVLGLAANLITVTCGLGADNRYFVAYQTLRYDPDREDPWHVWLKEHVPPGKKVLLVGDAQPFDLEVPALYSTAFDLSPFEKWVREHNVGEILQLFDQAGVSHIYVRWDEIERYQSLGNYGFSTFVPCSIPRRRKESCFPSGPTIRSGRPKKWA
jgi:hypothetical protein